MFVVANWCTYKKTEKGKKGTYYFLCHRLEVCSHFQKIWTAYQHESQGGTL